MKRAGNMATLALIATAVAVAVGTVDRAGQAQHTASSAAARQARGHVVRGAYGRLPLAFVPNRGQAAGRIRYVAQGAGYALGLGDGGATLALAGAHHHSGRLTLTTPGGTLRAPTRPRH